MTSCIHLVLLLVWMGPIYGQMSDNNTNQTEVGPIYGQMSYNNTNQTEVGDISEEYEYDDSKLAEEGYKALISNWNEFVSLTEKQEEQQINRSNFTFFDNLRYTARYLFAAKRNLQFCINSNECLMYAPGLSKLYRQSRNHAELLYVWDNLRDTISEKSKDILLEYQNIYHELYLDYNFTSWYIRSTGVADKVELLSLYEQIQPLYKHLHAYVRRNLLKMYGIENFPKSGHIPAHLLGDNMAKRWDRLIDDLAPFKNKPSTNVTDEMLKQNYTYLDMYELGDDYLGSLGLERMPEEFWNNSLLQHPNDGRGRACMGHAWDFYNKKDFRIAMCTEVNMDHLDKVFELMGRTEFSMQRRDLHINDRVFYNIEFNGFYYGVGNLVSLLALSPQSLHQKGLMPDFEDDYETNINYLMRLALHRVASLPFYYFHDHFIWSVFYNNTAWEDQNKLWWQQRCKHQGIFPPLDRSPSDLDYLAEGYDELRRPHIPKFLGHILAFQFHEAICKESGHTGPMHKCNINNDKTLNTTLSNMMRSRTSNEALELLTGQTKISVQPMLNFFAPLLEYLKAENENEMIGWDEECPSCINIA